MLKKFSLFSAGFSRMHPIFLIWLLVLILSFLTQGMIKYISVTIFWIIFLYVMIWLYGEIFGK